MPRTCGGWPPVPVAEYLSRPEEDPYPRGTAEAITAGTGRGRGRLPGGLGGRPAAVIAACSHPAGTSRVLLAGAVRRERAEVDAALQQFGRASLVTWSVDGATVAAHRLVMRVIREQAAAAQTLRCGRPRCDSVRLRGDAAR